MVVRFGVQVVCKGDNAYTDGQRIVLPSMPDPLDEGLERMMVGYLDHEMAHVAFSHPRTHPRVLHPIRLYRTPLAASASRQIRQKQTLSEDKKLHDRAPGIRSTAPFTCINNNQTFARPAPQFTRRGGPLLPEEMNPQIAQIDADKTGRIYGSSRI